MGTSCAGIFEAGMHRQTGDALAYPPAGHAYIRCKEKKDAEQHRIAASWEKAGEFAFCASLPAAGQLEDAALQDEYVALLVDEMRLYAPLMEGRRSLGFELFGSGAPLLSAGNMRRICDAVHELFVFKDGVSFSLSADVRSAAAGTDGLLAASACGYQRISLRLEPSAGKSGENEAAFRALRRSGFPRINVELPSCLPQQDSYDFDMLLQQALSLEPEYITLSRPPAQFADGGVYKCLHQYRSAYGLLTKAGYRTTWGKRTFTRIDYDYGTGDFVSSRIIRGVPYFGLGLGARAFGPGYASCNFGGQGGYARYKKALLAGQFPVDAVYALPPEECMAKFVAQSLRFGFIDLKAFQGRFGTEFAKVYSQQLQFLSDRHLLEKVGYRWCLTERGVDYLHGIAPLFYSPQEKKLLLSQQEKSGEAAAAGPQTEASAPREDRDEFGVKVLTAAFSFRTYAPENYRRNSGGELSVLLVRKGEGWALPSAYLRHGEDAAACAARSIPSAAGQGDVCCMGAAGSAEGKDVALSCLCVLKGTAAGDTVQDEAAAWFSVSLSGDGKHSFRLELGCGEERLRAVLRQSPASFGAPLLSCRSLSGLDAADAELLARALLLLRGRAAQFDVLFDFLPKKFTLAQLQQLLELLLGESVVGPNFRRKAAEFVVETGDYDTAAGHRPAKLFARRS